MKAASVKAILGAFHSHGVRFLIAGGLAVNAHGYLRFTKDVDFVIQLVPENIRCAFEALGSIGYRPIIPVSQEQFADESTRQHWIDHMQMKVLQFWSDMHPETPVDVFVESPFDFEREFDLAPRKELSDVGAVPIVSLATLIRMKETVGRPQDLADISQLKLLHG